MRRARRATSRPAAALLAGLLLPAAAAAQPAAPPRPAASGTPVAAPAAAPGTVAPRYLPYVEFSADDPPPRVTLKQAYNEAAKRYNEILYEYHVTLERHDALVALHNGTADPAQRRQARAEAAPLRDRLVALRHEVAGRANAVNDAARQAAAGGVAIPPR